ACGWWRSSASVTRGCASATSTSTATGATTAPSRSSRRTCPRACWSGGPAPAGDTPPTIPTVVRRPDSFVPVDVQGWVVVGLALILFGYLVPHLVQSRHQLAEARVEDRFSGTLRVVTTGATARRSSPGEHHGTLESRPYLHDPRRRTEAPAVNRPTTPSERAAAEARRLAQLRAARAAEISRRKAAARRRLVLTVVLLLASVGGWLGFSLGSLPVALGVVPTVLLAGVLVLGRRTAKVAARRNAADRAAMARLEVRPAPRTRTAPSARPAVTAAARTSPPATGGASAAVTAGRAEGA